MEAVNHEYYVSLEIAKLLKRVGFDWKVNHYYFMQNGKLEIKSDFRHPAQNYNEPMATMDSKSFEFEVYSCPTLDVAQRWLREVKGYHIYISHTYTVIDGQVKSAWEILYEKMSFLKPNSILILEDDFGRSFEFDTYEEAQEAGIKKVLEIILKGEE